jgi:hypothetical protein
MNHLPKAGRNLAGAQPEANIFPRPTALPDPPLPPFFKGGLGGDFRDGPAKHDFLAIFKIFDFGRRGDESRVFRKKPILKKRIFG